MQVGDILELKIEKLNSEGDGIARVDGFVLFVKNSCPEDVLKCKITKLNKSYGFAQIEEIILYRLLFYNRKNCKKMARRMFPPCHFWIIQREIAADDSRGSFSVRSCIILTSNAVRSVAFPSITLV